VRVSVKVAPRSSRNNVEGPDAEGRVRVRCTAPPVGNKANMAVVEALARHFDVAKSAVTIVAGQGSRNKIVEIRR